MTRIIGIAGSLRRGSYNKMLLRAAVELAPEGVTIEALKKLTQFFGDRPDQRRPPKVRILWGAGGEALDKFDAVIESVSVKYTMFSPEGKVLRATANVKLKEASSLKVGKAGS